MLTFLSESLIGIPNLMDKLDVSNNTLLKELNCWANRPYLNCAHNKYTVELTF